MAKTLRHPVTNEVKTVYEEAEIEKLCKAGWKFTSKYELKRINAMAKAKQQRTEAA